MVAIAALFVSDYSMTRVHPKDSAWAGSLLFLIQLWFKAYSRRVEFLIVAAVIVLTITKSVRIEDMGIGAAGEI